MPCTNCNTALDEAIYAKDGHRYVTTCPQCTSICIYVPEGYGIGNTQLTAQEISVIKKIFGENL